METIMALGYGVARLISNAWSSFRSLLKKIGTLNWWPRAKTSTDGWSKNPLAYLLHPNAWTGYRITFSLTYLLPELWGLSEAWSTKIILIIAGLASTDKLDGWLARKTGQITDWGKFLDPLADKVFVCILVYSKFYYVHKYVLGIDAGRHLFWSILTIGAALTVLRTYRILASLLLNKKKVDVAASPWGKLKMLTESVGIILIGLPDLFFVSGFGSEHTNTFFIAGWALLWIAVPLGMASFLSQFKKVPHKKLRKKNRQS